MPLFPALTGVAGTLPLPNTAPTPAAGEPVRAADIQNAVQALLNQDATLAANFPIIKTQQALSDATWLESPANDGAWHDTASVHLDFTSCVVGDVITVWLTGQITTGGATTGMRMGFRDDFSSTNVLAETTISTPTVAQSFNPIAFSCSHTVTVAGTCRVILRLMRSGGTVMTFHGDPGSMLAQRVRLGA